MASEENPDYKLRDKPKKEFNKIRRILLRNIPPSTEGEIEEFLGQFKAEKIEISESLDSAIVTLTNGRQLEEAVTELDNKKLKDNDVTVTFCASDKLICVAHLPPRYSDDELHKMLEEHGKMKTCFIMRSETTGHSKSYALLEFEEQDVDKVRQIRDDIDWKEVGSHLLHADFIEPSYQTWDRLQSRCLAVSGLPKEFTETNKLREMFSVVTSPVYCQIVMFEKESLGMGIVEFRKPEEAEETWEKVQGSKIEDKEITVTFCIPSKSAVFVNNRIMWKFSDKVQKSSLLPDPVAAKPVISNNAIVLSLVKQNPNLIEDFTKVLAEFHQAYVNHMMSPGNKPGLLGPAPTLPMSPMMNPHLQMGLLIMLVLHIHAEKKEPFTGVLAKQLNSLTEPQSANQSTEGKKPSILGDPMTAQANIVLSNLKKQLNQVPVTEEDKRVVTSSSAAVRSVMAKFMQNARFLNLNLLVNLGQMVMNMHANAHPDNPIAQASSAAASSARHPGGGSLLNPPGSGKGLLGDVPRPNPNPATMRFMKTLEAVASQKIGGQNRGLLSAIMTNINVNPTMGKLEKKTSLLGEPPQHLKQQKDRGPGLLGGPGGRNMGGNMGSSGNMGNMGGNMSGMGNSMGGMGNTMVGMGNMGMGSMDMGGMDNMGGGMGNMGGGMGGMGNMGGGMGNMGGGMNNMGGGMGGNMGGGMGGNMGGGMGGNMGGGMGGNMSGAMGGSMGGGMGVQMGGGMGDMTGMGQQSGNKQNWGSGMGQGAMGRAASGNTTAGSKTDSYSTFGNYSGGYGDISGYSSGYTEEYTQFNQGDYSSAGYGDASMYGGDQSGYQYSDYSGSYGTGQESYNFQGSNNYSGNFGDYTGGYSSSSTGNTGFNLNQNQSGNVQDGGRFGGGGGGNWATQGGSNTASTAAGMGNEMRNNMGMSKNFSGGGTGPGGGSGMGQGAGGAFGSSTNALTGFGVGNSGASGGSRQGLLNTPRGTGGGSMVGGSYGAQGTGTAGMGRSNTSAESYQTSSGQSYMTGSNTMGGSTNMGSYTAGYGSGDMEGYNTGGYDDGSGTGGYGGYSMGDYSSYNQSGYTSTDNMASYSTAGGNTAGMMTTSNPLTPAGSKRGYGDYGGQQSLANQYDKRPRLY